MRLKQQLAPKLVQKLIMTQQMQQSMQVLQLPILELKSIIEQELTNNPCLEDATIEQGIDQAEPNKKEEFSPADEPEIRSASSILENTNKQSDSIDEENWHENFYEQMPVPNEEFFTYKTSLITKGASLQEDLLKQLKLYTIEPDIIKIGEVIIGNIDDNGYLKATLEEIAASMQKNVPEVEAALKIVQQLEPAGIAARDLKECLLLQLERKNALDDITRRIIMGYLEELGKKRFSQVAKTMQITLSKVKKIADIIAGLDPKPGRNISKEDIPSITPDIVLEKTDEGYNIIINNQSIPHIRVNQLYKKILQDKTTDDKTKDFLKQKMYAATGLIRSLYLRQQTLVSVVQCIINVQHDFLEKGMEYLKPMSLKQVAVKINMHESTISRAVANKYIQTGYGVIALKSFFSTSLARDDGESDSAASIKFEIERLISSEPKENPLSDQEIISALKQKGITLARRTVAKYRQQLKILPTYLRKK